MVGRGRRRLPVGPRRARHEVADRGRGRRRDDAGARGLAPARGELMIIARRRRGDRRRRGRAVADRAAPRRGALRLAAQRGRRRGLSPSATGALYGVCVAEKGVFRFRCPPTASRATRRCRGWATTRCSSSPRSSGARRRAAALRRHRDAAGAARRARRPRRRPRAGARARCASATRLAVLVEPMLGVTLAPTSIFASEKINVIPARAELRVDCRVPPGMDGGRGAARIHEVLGDRDGVEVEFLEEVIGNRSPLDSPLMDAIARLGRPRGPGRRGADRAARVHRLALVPRRLPGLRRLRLLPAAPPDALRDLAADPLAPTSGSTCATSASPPLLTATSPRSCWDDARSRETAPPRRDGAAQRPARPRPDPLGRRRARRRRRDRGRLGPKPRVRGRRRRARACAASCGSARRSR